MSTLKMLNPHYLLYFKPGDKSQLRPYGEYEIRAYFDNGAVVKARAVFKVGNADASVTAQTEKNRYLPTEKIMVSYSGLPGHEKDWIALSSAGSADENYVSWQYTDGKQKGNMEFPPLPVGNYEVRAYFNNEGTVRSRYPFVVSTQPDVNPSQFCRKPLSVFFAGVTGLGTAWARTTCEPTTMSAIGIRDIQAVLGNARDGLNMMKDCIPFDITELELLIRRIPSLTNVQAEAEIQAIIKKIQAIIASSGARCTNGATLSALYVSAVHLGAAQAHANCQICKEAPMPMAFQTVIRNHLNTARDAFAAYLPCVPGVSLTQFDAVPLNSINSLEAHTHIVGLHTNLLWNISLSDCCCDCR
ncbi:MAG: hypothetical protein KDC66_18395 [Phaeodactylibacter sp.]|nr:hypothetical protein [Phaeodactylibacter sp.]